MLYFSVVDTFILRMERVAIVNKIAHWVNTSKFAQKSLRAVSDNPAFASAAVSFVAASVLRPSAQAVLPIRNEQDKGYHSVICDCWCNRTNYSSFDFYTS